MGAPAVANLPKHGVYHSDLLASNAVHAVYKGIRSIPVVDLAVSSPATEEVAVFEVKQNLAHRRYDRMGDGALNPGKLFSVSLAADVPGQDADVGRQIREMKPGDEALLNIDHIYLFRDDGNENVRACTRFAKVEARADATPSQIAQQPASDQSGAPQAPTAGQTPSASSPAQPASAEPTNEAQKMAPLPSATKEKSTSYASSVESRISMVPDGKGGTRCISVETRREWIDGEDKPRVRKFINGVEVDPATDRPLIENKAATPDKPVDAAPEKSGEATDKAPSSPAASPDAPIAPEFGF